MHSRFEFLQRSLNLRRLLSIFLLELIECEFVHLFLDEHQYFVDLLDEIHLFDHFSLFHLLYVEFLLYFADLSLFVHLYFVIFVYLLGLATLLSIQVQQIEFGQNISSMFEVYIAWKTACSELNSVLIYKLKLKSFKFFFVAVL